VPFTVIGDRVTVGYYDDATTGAAGGHGAAMPRAPLPEPGGRADGAVRRRDAGIEPSARPRPRDPVVAPARRGLDARAVRSGSCSVDAGALH
jgi:hypothetical protein